VVTDLHQIDIAVDVRTKAHVLVVGRPAVDHMAYHAGTRLPVLPGQPAAIVAHSFCGPHNGINDVQAVVDLCGVFVIISLSLRVLFSSF